VDRSHLGAALRAWRARVRPEDVGVAHRGARRTPGLRRDEVATRSRVSVEYVIRLEQGLARNPSRQVLDALARALRLSSPEREHLLRLAGMTPPVAAELPRAVPPSVQRLLQRLDELPVAVFDATWTLLSWNRMWAALFGEPPEPGGSRNLVWQLFAVPAETSRIVRTDEERQAFAATVVADLRTAAGRYPVDAALHALIAELRRTSDRFTALWAAHAVDLPTSSRKTVHHPEVGLVTLDCDVLAVAGADLRVVVYTAEPGTAEADALALLRVVGTQAFSP
jgi:transcriptional regulator with XRE-family HTH domain